MTQLHSASSSSSDAPGAPGPAPPAQSGIEARGIVKRFAAPAGSRMGPAGGAGVLALDGVDFRAGAGEFVTLLGPSGCGKSTLLRIIAGLETPDAGDVLLNGASMLALPASRRPINMVFQSYALFPHLDVFENVAFGLRSRRVPRAEADRRVAEALAMLRIDDLARRAPDQLSGGQRQRAALARALVNEPEALLLDEPMSALDAKLRAEVQLELRRLQRRLGRAFILVTHDQDEAMSVSDRIVVMREGRIEQEGPPEEVYERPATRFAAKFLGAANLIEAAKRGDGALDTALGVLKIDREPEWSQGWVAIRPERVRVLPGPGAGPAKAATSGASPTQNALRVRVVERVFRGDGVDLFVEPGGLRVRVAAGLIGCVPDDEIRIELPPDALQPLRD